MPIAAFVLSASLQSLASDSPGVVARAKVRAEGNDRARAIAVGSTLLATVWPAQVLNIRVDSVGHHHVAGIMLSGTRFHARLDEDGFLREVRRLVVTALGDGSLEEVDVWAVVPLTVPKGANVSGPSGEPTMRTVFSITVQRNERDHLDTLLHSNDVYWESTWRSELSAARNAGTGRPSR